MQTNVCVVSVTEDRSPRPGYSLSKWTNLVTREGAGDGGGKLTTYIPRVNLSDAETSVEKDGTWRGGIVRHADSFG